MRRWFEFVEGDDLSSGWSSESAGEGEGSRQGGMKEERRAPVTTEEAARLIKARHPHSIVVARDVGGLDGALRGAFREARGCPVFGLPPLRLVLGGETAFVAAPPLVRVA